MTHSTHKMKTNDTVASKAIKASKASDMIEAVLLMAGVIIGMLSLIIPLSAAYGHLPLHNDVMLTIIFFGGQILGWGLARYMVTR